MTSTKIINKHNENIFENNEPKFSQKIIEAYS